MSLQMRGNFDRYLIPIDLHPLLELLFVLFIHEVGFCYFSKQPTFNDSFKMNKNQKEGSW